MSESLKTLPIGTRVYYTGDMANLPAVGTIVEHKPSARFSDQLRIEWDKEEGLDHKPDSWVCPVNFSLSPGCRFFRLAEWEANRREQIEDARLRMAEAIRITMQYERTIKTLEKAGFTVAREIRDSTIRPGEQYEEGFVARQPGSRRRIEAYRQDDEVISMRVIRDNDRDDMQSDYHAGAWVDTVKRAIELATIDYQGRKP